MSNSEKERYEKEFSQERQQEILRRAARVLPIYTTSASKSKKKNKCSFSNDFKNMLIPARIYLHGLTIKWIL